MALWLVRAGKYGDHEQQFLADSIICLTKSELEDTDLSSAEDLDAIKQLVQNAYQNEPPRRVRSWASQVGTFVLGMKPGDWVVLPRKTQSSIAVGEITGHYKFDPSKPPTQRHSRKVKWLNREVPRAAFDQDLLYSFGAFLAICEISRNDAEQRVRAMATAGWKSSPVPSVPSPDSGEVDAEEFTDLGQMANDQLTKLISRRYTGHGLARLIDAILTAQGYTTHVSPAGPDKGVDILAAPDALGFGSPRICVQVKSGDTPVDRPTLQQLGGVMKEVGAEQGLLVSWAGFKSSVEKETANQFFRVRLWDAKDVVEQLLAKYERLPADLRAELPLKRIWVVAASEQPE